jgi:NAD-dependent DNA ligase
VQKREQLEKLAESMGAKLIKEVTDNCLLITTRKDTEKVSKARKCKNVKVLSPKYIEECKQCEASLNESDYFLHL